MDENSSHTPIRVLGFISCLKCGEVLWRDGEGDTSIRSQPCAFNPEPDSQAPWPPYQTLIMGTGEVAVDLCPACGHGDDWLHGDLTNQATLCMERGLDPIERAKEDVYLNRFAEFEVNHDS